MRAAASSWLTCRSCARLRARAPAWRRRRGPQQQQQPRCKGKRVGVGVGGGGRLKMGEDSRAATVCARTLGVRRECARGECPTTDTRGAGGARLRAHASGPMHAERERDRAGAASRTATTPHGSCSPGVGGLLLFVVLNDAAAAASGLRRRVGRLRAVAVGCGRRRRGGRAAFCESNVRVSGGKGRLSQIESAAALSSQKPAVTTLAIPLTSAVGVGAARLGLRWRLGASTARTVVGHDVGTWGSR